jgi:hypothetical protein
MSEEEVERKSLKDLESLLREAQAQEVSDWSSSADTQPLHTRAVTASQKISI